MEKESADRPLYHPVSQPGNSVLRVVTKYRLPIVSAALAIAVVVLVILAVELASRHSEPPQPVQNVILLIGDGFGLGQATLARAAYSLRPGDTLPGNPPPLTLDTFLAGSSRTHSADTLVTDSAAGATALSCAQKTNNRMIAMLPNGEACQTILEAARLQKGMRTGLISTSRVTHATPASFAAHVPERDEEATIAQQMAAAGVDVLMGGGRRYFLPNGTTGSKRPDEWDGVEQMRQDGYTVVETTAELEGFASQGATSGKLLGLFSLSHMDYVIERPATQPSLSQMFSTALPLLQNSNGFFLMVEGSRIDMACHKNDAASMVKEVLEFEDVAARVLDFAKQDGHTLVVATADHETGGVSLGYQADPLVYPVYRYDPRVLWGMNISVESAAAVIEDQAKAAVAADPNTNLTALIDASIKQLYNVSGSSSDLAEAAACLQYDLQDTGARQSFPPAVGRVVSHTCDIGWTTAGHTGMDVPLYAAGAGADAFAGSLENSDIGARLATAANVKL
eukprot:TRINITY_DN917_c0_g1_i1.p1 TRINITY_DN917_c0_g1~~TRINITY_DN917_c0_g1_i1.p1  ORF type:complete len:527 (+),score=173.29 TRINITY_DN917_c0_g1_i1:55-1581(+)